MLIRTQLNFFCGVGVDITSVCSDGGGVPAGKAAGVPKESEHIRGGREKARI